MQRGLRKQLTTRTFSFGTVRAEAPPTYDLTTKKGITMFKETAIAGLLAAAATTGVTFAADPEPTPEHTLTGNVGLFSQYIFRGLTQTNREPALQGGFDYAHRSSTGIASCITGGETKLIDFLFHGSSLRATPIPPMALNRQTILPSPECPSDHVPLAAEFEWV